MSAGELVGSKYDSEKRTEKKYAAHLFNGISASNVNITIRCVHFTLSQDVHLQEDVRGGGWYFVSQWFGTSSHSRPLPMPFNFIINESTDIHQGHVGSEGG